MNNNQNDPSMFIQTVSSFSKIDSNQKEYDSRRRITIFKTNKINKKEVDKEILEKINKLIKCYNVNLIVESKLICDEEIYYEGVIKNINNDSVLINDNLVSIFKIKDIEILNLKL